MSATMSILGLYNYDSTIFDDMYIPANIDKDLLVDNLLEECAELEILYSDPQFMKFAIGRWSNRMKITWDKLDALFNEEYDPLYNVDAHELTTETRDLSTTSANTETRDLASASGNTETRNLASIEDATNTHSVSGYNSAEFANAERDVNDVNASETGTINNDGNASETGVINNDSDASETGTITTEHRRYGNIGVTMAQQMIEKEMEVRPAMNMYTYIIQAFKQKFCLLIY